MLLDGKPAAAYTNITLIVEMLTDVYLAVSNDYSPEGGSAMAVQGRRSLQQLALAQLAQLNTIITSLATGISASNSAMQEVLAVVSGACVACWISCAGTLVACDWQLPCLRQPM